MGRPLLDLPARYGRLRLLVEFEVHLVLDNFSATWAPRRRWLDQPKRERWHLRSTPTGSSWLNPVERWFGELTTRRLRRGIFTSVDHLIEAIELWAEAWNLRPQPFIWHTTTQEIIEKVSRGRATLHQIKSATEH